MQVRHGERGHPALELEDHPAVALVGSKEVISHKIVPVSKVLNLLVEGGIRHIFYGLEWNLPICRSPMAPRRGAPAAGWPRATTAGG